MLQYPTGALSIESAVYKVSIDDSVFSESVSIDTAESNESVDNRFRSIQWGGNQ